jgi:hypothetical protein
MPIAKIGYLTFPVKYLQLINYTPASYSYFNLYLPLITSDSQLGTEILFVKGNGVGSNTAPSSGTTGLLYISVQSGNNLYTPNGTLNSLGTGSSVYFYCSCRVIAIKDTGGVYAWYVIQGGA